MKRKKAITVVIALTIILSGFIACSNKTDPEGIDTDTDTIVIPEEIQNIMDKTVDLAADYALQLDGEWADKYIECIELGQGSEYDEYEDLKSTLDQFRIESGAVRLYVLSDMDTGDQYFELTVDGSPEPGDWLAEYEIIEEYLIAQEGIPCSTKSAYNLEHPAWQAYAPVYDSDGNVVGILGLDYPAPEIIEFPEWNRDSEEWNGMTAE